jgi:hypothetical protein
MMTPLGVVLTLGLALMVLTMSRRMAAVSIVATVCYLTEGQPLELLGSHFTAIRFVLLVGLIRVISQGELSRLRLNSIDKSLFLFAVAVLIISTIRVGTVSELVYQVGCLFDILVSYLIFRCLVKGERDFREILEKLAFVILPFALLMGFESLTDRNVFAVFGGVEQISWIRDGHVRSEGPFRNPITAGAFGAMFTMLFACPLMAKRRTQATWVGLVASILIVFFARSSGPFLGLILGIFALACWPLRKHLRIICWGLVAALVGLQLVMKAPIWFLMDRVSEVVGGGGYHRAELIDQFIHRFNSWWLVGISDTSDWFPYQLADGQSDMTNVFVAAGVSAGIVGLILAILVVNRCFKRVGLALRANRGQPTTERMLWGIGATLVGNIGVLFSVTYFDQMHVIWYFFLACIAGLHIRKPASWGPTFSRNGLESFRSATLAGASRKREVQFCDPSAN